jgi:phage baseplate assembly protein gpV
MSLLKLFGYLCLAPIVGLFTGCTSDGGVTPTPGAGTAQVLVSHASPNAPGVDLLVDNSVVGTNLTYPNNTGYLTVPAGTRNIKVRVTGTTTTVIDANVPLAANAVYSVFAADSVSNLTPVVLTDDLTAPAAGKAHVRFVHLAPNAPAVDIALQGGAVVFPNTVFKNSTAFTPLDAGTYNLEVRVAGTSTVVLSLPNVTFANGGIYTVFARGFVGGSGEQGLGAQTIVNTQSTAPARVMAIHASPDAPSVDLLVDNTISGTNLTFPNNTGYLNVPAGSRNIKVNVAGTSTTVINATLTLDAGAAYSVFATDSVSRLAPLVLVDNLSAPASGKAHIRFIHLSPNAPAVDVALQGGAVVFGNTSFGENSTLLPLDAGTYNLEVRLAGTNTVVLPLPNIMLQAGKIYTVFARGFVGGVAEQSLNAQIILNN